MNTSTNESSIAALAAKANEKKKSENKGREALAETQAQNNKSAKPEKKVNKSGKRRNVYFSPKSLDNLDRIEEMDEVGMSPAIQAALYMFANATDKKREAVYKELKIQCKFDD